ncbi:ABC transporter ATP-binding protein [Haliscomenobacter sp.]|uniref:ABC transporter ATP-binding protein n=1 Tax=Haliscomenobacter sp. TaxID=2717303 RepID=UPI00359364B6
MFLAVKNMFKSYQGESVLCGVSLELEVNQTLAILGKSGCGKTTLLKAIAGLTPAAGQIYVQGQDINLLKPQQRSAVYLYQEPLLFPHYSVFENIAFGLRLRKLAPPEIDRRTAQMLEDLELAEHPHKMPHELSGGQKQRVAFGRALIVQPMLLLLDEPFASLDPETRSNMQALFKRLTAEHGITSLFVTHDLKEALKMGDRLGYMERGKLDLFPDYAAFAADVRTGMSAEIEFWKKL